MLPDASTVMFAGMLIASLSQQIDKELGTELEMNYFLVR